MTTLVFQLRAPLAAFGNTNGELRLSDKAPRKSAVMGLLAAALGITRHEPAAFTRLVSSLKMAVGVLRDPQALVDFHTVQAPVKQGASSRAMQLRGVRVAEATGSYKNTIVTRREYLQDGHWAVVLTGDDTILAELKAALNAPKFVLYLGRKSCALSAYAAPLLVPALDLSQALRAWGTHANVAIPDQLSMTWEAPFEGPTEQAIQLHKSDVRTRLDLPHFSARTLYTGLCTLRKDTLHVSDPT